MHIFTTNLAEFCTFFQRFQLKNAHVYISSNQLRFMLRRKMMDELLRWKARDGHKSLLLKGQRQVGKTSILKEFGRTYQSCIYFDLSIDSGLCEQFQRSVDVDSFVRYATAKGPEYTPVAGETLIILDEIQSCPRAKMSLKQFTIDGRFDVVASGSLIDVPSKEFEDPTALTPAGYVEHKIMYGMDFEEYLWAMGYTEDAISGIKRCIRDGQPMGETIASAYLDRFDEYLTVGGMPEAVDSFAKKKDYAEVSSIQSDIIDSFYNDVAKYSSGSDTMKIRKCFQSVPTQLSDTNKKFMWSRLDGSGSRNGQRTYADAMLWMENSGVANMCYMLRSVSFPSAMNADPSNFKVYLSDTGLLVNMLGSGARMAIIEKDDRFNQGALMENAIAGCIVKSGRRPCYYINRKNPGRMEIDFVLDLGMDVTAIEVKSGKDRDAASLNKTIDDPRFQRSIMLERADISVDPKGIEHYPLFAAAFLDEMVRSR